MFSLGFILGASDSEVVEYLTTNIKFQNPIARTLYPFVIA